MKRTHTATYALALLALLGLAATSGGLGTAQEQDAPENSVLEETAQQQEPSFYVHAEFAGSLRGEYQEGDSLTLNVRSEEDAYLYILYEQADGKTFQIFPNSSQKDNRVKAGETVQVPKKDDLFRWRIGPPFGKEVVKVIASKAPVDSLSDESKRRSIFNPIGTKDIEQASDTLEQSDPTKWAEVELAITTLPRDETPGAPGARRWGVFFGVSDYMQDEATRYFEDVPEEKKQGFSLQGAHKDIERLSEVFASEGGMRGQQVYFNEDATRENMKYAITKWLPSVSRPGDTVVIVFSGHGGPIPDNNGDESDGHDEVLCTYDYLGTREFERYMELSKQGLLTPYQQSVYERALTALERAGDNNATAAIQRATGVDDDVFAHWIQKLAGRQVLIITDACHSGGFATDEKSLDGNAQGRAATLTFDFCDGEAARLKDIGQPEQAILAAARAGQSSAEHWLKVWQACADRVDSGMRIPFPRINPDVDTKAGLFTLSLFRALQQLQGPVTADKAFEFCISDIEAMFNEYDAMRQESNLEPDEGRFQPHFKNYCTRPIIFKP